MMKRLIMLLFLAFLGNIGFAQPSPFDQKFVDSITTRLSTLPDDTAKVNNLASLASMYLLVNPTLTVKYANEGADIAEKINYPLGKIECLGQSAFYYAVSGEWAKATININEAIPLCEKYQPDRLIYMYNLMVINALTKGDNKLGMQYALKALHHPAFPALTELAKWPTYMQVGRAYENVNQLDSARYYSKILSMYIKKYGTISPDLTDNCYVLLGNIAFKEKNYQEALKNYYLASNLIGLAQTYKILNQPDSVIFHALRGLKMAQTQNNHLLIQETAKILAQEYELSNPKEANKYLKIYVDSKDSLYNNEKLKQLEEIRFNEERNQYRHQKKEAAERNKFIIIALSVILGSLFVFSLLLWRNNRFKQKANLELETTLKELKATQTQLIQSEKLASLGELTAGIAHEIQNPLNFVNNFSELSVDLVKDLKDEFKKPEKDEAYIDELFDDLSQNQEKINHHGKRASSIVKGMLEHSRASTGVKELTDINKLADEYLRLSYHGLRAKDKSFNADFKTDFDENLPKIEVIPQDIGRVLLNLINNAFYAVNQRNTVETGHGLSLPKYEPTVTIQTSYSNSQIEISIKDNGTGMPESVRAKVFQPFFTTKPTGSGTGLGLSLAYDIVTKGHSGTLEVKSTEGVGSEFIIALPFKTYSG